MGAIGLRRQANFTRHIEGRGEDTTVNGATMTALWQDAEVARIQQFLHESEWDKESFQLRMPYYASAAPYSVKNGTEVLRVDLDWRGVVRGMTPERSDAETLQWNCLVVLVAE